MRPKEPQDRFERSLLSVGHDPPNGHTQCRADPASREPAGPLDPLRWLTGKVQGTDAEHGQFCIREMAFEATPPILTHNKTGGGKGRLRVAQHSLVGI